MLTHLKVIIITVSFIGWRLNVKIVPKVHPHKVPIICTNCSKALDPWGIIPREAWRKELLGHWVSIGKVLAVFFLYLGRHCLYSWGGSLRQVKEPREQNMEQEWACWSDTNFVLLGQLHLQVFQANEARENYRRRMGNIFSWRLPTFLSEYWDLQFILNSIEFLVNTRAEDWQRIFSSPFVFLQQGWQKSAKLNSTI